MSPSKSSRTGKSRRKSLDTTQQGTPIVYKEYLQHATHVTGIAYYSDPEGHGNFRISVNGQQPAVDLFAQEARILSMHIAPGRDEDFATLRERQAEACRRRAERRERQNAARKRLASKDDLATLSEGELRKLKIDASDPLPEHDSQTPNLQRDRLIQIEVLDKLEAKTPYFLTCSFDPISVAKGTCDIWNLFDDAVEEACADLTWRGGDPDLYLFRGADQQDRSINGPPRPGGGDGSERVDGSGGSGTWKLHVYGYDDGSLYDIFQTWRWYQDPYGDDVPDSH